MKWLANFHQLEKGSTRWPMFYRRNGEVLSSFFNFILSGDLRGLTVILKLAVPASNTKVSKGNVF